MARARAGVVVAAGTRKTAAMEMATAADVAAGMAVANSSTPLLRSHGRSSLRRPGILGLVSECRRRRRKLITLVVAIKGGVVRAMVRVIAMTTMHPDNNREATKEGIRAVTRVATRAATKEVSKATRDSNIGALLPRARTGVTVEVEAEGTAAAAAATGATAILGAIGSRF
jgi:hypothetical protein